MLLADALRTPFNPPSQRQAPNHQLISLAFACSFAEDAASDHPPAGFDPTSLSFKPRKTLVAKTDADITEFVNKVGTEKVCGLELSIGKCTAAGLSQLSKLKGVYVIQLEGKDMKWTEKDGLFYFKPALTDEQFQEIIKIQSLEAIQIWYGSVSEEQKKLLKEKLPNCVIFENLNKL